MTAGAVAAARYGVDRTAHEWLGGAATRVRENLDRERLAGYRAVALAGSRSLAGAGRHDSDAALKLLGSQAAEVIGVASPQGVRFASGVRCNVPTPVRPPAGDTAQSWPLKFTCDGIPAMAMATRVPGSNEVVIAGGLLGEEYADTLSQLTQAEVMVSGRLPRAISTFRDRDGRRLSPALPEEGFGRLTLPLPNYRGYTGGPEPIEVGSPEVDFYYAVADLDPVAFPGARVALAIPCSVLRQGATFTALVMVATMAVVLLAMVLLARRLAQRITSPMHSLMALTHRIADGDLEAEVTMLSSIRELNDLGDAFNRMVTSLKEMRRRVFQTEKLAAVGQLSASVAHEINNPLAYIIGNLSFAIERVKAKEPLEDALEESLDGAKRIAQIVRDLKTFSRSEDDQTEQTRVDVETTLDSAVKMAGNRIRHRARLVKNYAPVGEVLANPGRLAQVFLNLLVNSADAIAPGRADENQILLKLSQHDGEVTVEITDTGGGIPNEVRARLFEPFFTTKPIGVGTGLGLSICKNIVEAAGGSIAIEPGPARRGTTVRVTLPLAPAEPSADEDVTRRLETTPVRTELARVLVIDDDQAVLRSVKRMLEPAYTVVTVSSASAALDRLGAGERFDLLICDLMMPEVTGIELHQHLSRSAPALSKRMLFITGGAFTPDAAPFLDENRARVLEKPIGPAQLRDAVALAIATHEKARGAKA